MDQFDRSQILKWLNPIGLRNFHLALNWLKRNPYRVVGLSIITALCLIAALAPVLAPYEPRYMGWAPFLKPGPEHWLGTDDMGKDIFSQFLYASRISIAVGFAAATVAITIGVAVVLQPAIIGGGWRTF